MLLPNAMFRVLLENGHMIKAEYVVNCAGMWARQLAQHHTNPPVVLPNQAAEHYYLVTGMYIKQIIIKYTRALRYTNTKHVHTYVCIFLQRQ